MISFARPFFLFLFAFFPVHYILIKKNIIKKTNIELALLNWNSKTTLTKPHVNFLYRISKLIILLATVLLIFAVATPVRYESKKVFAGAGNSIMFIVDVSPSMTAKDMGGKTRLSVAKTVITDFVENHKEHSFGLTALGSTAAMLIPPTMDHATFMTRLNSLQAGELGNGSAIGMGIATATVHTAHPKEGKSYIVLLTDGENNTGKIHPQTAVKVASRKDIHFYVIGLGKTGYAEVEYTNPNTNEKVNGTMYTNFNEAMLKKIANVGNGHYAFASTPEDLSNVFKKFTSEIPPPPTGFYITVEANMTSFFLKIVLALLCLSWFIKRVILGALI
ncbi:MAG: aerotolerance regulator BatA [Treponema sp.]|nr:MAG: aerotolerance regulator BatA [Treponema sp.]